MVIIIIQILISTPSLVYKPTHPSNIIKFIWGQFISNIVTKHFTTTTTITTTTTTISTTTK